MSASNKAMERIPAVDDGGRPTVVPPPRQASRVVDAKNNTGKTVGKAVGPAGSKKTGKQAGVASTASPAASAAAAILRGKSSSGGGGGAAPTKASKAKKKGTSTGRRKRSAATHADSTAEHPSTADARRWTDRAEQFEEARARQAQYATPAPGPSFPQSTTGAGAVVDASTRAGADPGGVAGAAAGDAGRGDACGADSGIGEVVGIAPGNGDCRRNPGRLWQWSAKQCAAIAKDAIASYAPETGGVGQTTVSLFESDADDDGGDDEGGRWSSDTDRRQESDKEKGGSSTIGWSRKVSGPASGIEPRRAGGYREGGPGGGIGDVAECVLPLGVRRARPRPSPSVGGTGTEGGVEDRRVGWSGGSVGDSSNVDGGGNRGSKRAAGAGGERVVFDAVAMEQDEQTARELSAALNRNAPRRRAPRTVEPGAVRAPSTVGKRGHQGGAVAGSISALSSGSGREGVKPSPDSGVSRLLGSDRNSGHGGGGGSDAGGTAGGEDGGGSRTKPSRSDGGRSSSSSLGKRSCLSRPDGAPASAPAPASAAGHVCCEREQAEKQRKGKKKKQKPGAKGLRSNEDAGVRRTSVGANKSEEAKSSGGGGGGGVKTNKGSRAAPAPRNEGPGRIAAAAAAAAAAAVAAAAQAGEKAGVRGFMRGGHPWTDIGLHFGLGSTVEALWDDGRWYRCCVSSVSHGGRFGVLEFLPYGNRISRVREYSTELDFREWIGDGRITLPETNLEWD